MFVTLITEDSAGLVVNVIKFTSKKYVRTSTAEVAHATKDTQGSAFSLLTLETANLDWDADIFLKM